MDQATLSRWEANLDDLLGEMSAVQDELLTVLTAKRDSMAENNLDKIAELHPAAEQLSDRLQACHQRRETLLAEAQAHGISCDSLAKLATTLPGNRDGSVGKRVREASARMRLLQHHSLTNWVLAQRTLLHLSQLLEIIATGGQLQPTYSKGESSAASGALVDREA